jgi:hypothetical protein
MAAKCDHGSGADGQTVNCLQISCRQGFAKAEEKEEVSIVETHINKVSAISSGLKSHEIQVQPAMLFTAALFLVESVSFLVGPLRQF